MNRGVCFALLILLCAATFGFSQEVSEKKDVSVFNLSYYSFRIPDRVLANIDASIRGVFVNMGRFKILQVTKNFDNHADLQSFLDEIRKMKEEKMEIPNEVAYGRMTFSEDDYNQLVSSFIVIIPELLTYTSEENDKGVFEVNLKTSYSVLDASTMEVIAQPIIDSNGSDTKSSSQALESAISSMTAMLTYEVKKIPIFTLKTGVLEVNGAKMTLEKGRDMGILPGFEFEIISTQVLSSGKKKDISDGLVIVSDVFEEVSDAVVIYGEPKEGDQLKEVPRVGVDFTLFYRGVYELDTRDILSLFGFKATLALGVFGVRPVIEMEIPFFDVYGIGGFILLAGIPMNIHIGAEFPIYIGRLQLSPTLMFGLGGIVTYEPHNDQYFFPTHFGPTAYMNISYLVTRDTKLSVDIGYKFMFSILSEFLTSIRSYSGPLFGAGVTFKL
jgi:hypothetical protein